MTEKFTSRSLFEVADLQLPIKETTTSRSSTDKWWNDQLYVDRIAPNPELNRSFAQAELSLQSLAEMLWFDVEHLVREISLAETTTVYYMDITETEFLGDGYGDENLTLLLSNFVQSLSEKGLNTSRAMVEHLVFERIQRYFAKLAGNQVQLTAQPKTYIIVTSPPDHISRGYHGSDSVENFSALETHHSFLYVMEFAEPTPSTSSTTKKAAQIKVTQYRTWHNMAGLLDLHQRLGCPVVPDAQVPIPNQLFANSIILETDKAISSTEVHTYLKEQFYLGSEEWFRNPSQAPQLENPVAFDQEWRSFFKQFYLKKALLLYREITPETQQPEKLEPLLKQLELLFSFFIRAIEKRVQESNVNPFYTQLVEAQLLKDMQEHPEQADQLQQQLDELRTPTKKETLQQRRRKIAKAYEIQVKHEVLGIKLSQQEAQWYNANVGDVLAISGQVMGMAQCYTLAPLSTLSKVAANLNSSPESLSLFKQSLETVPLSARKELYNHLLEQNYVELRLPGAKRVYMVPASYLEEPGCTVLPNGDVLGPCNILLDEDALALPMTQEQFDHFMMELGHSITADEITEDVFSLEDENKKAQARQLVLRLSKLLFKPSVGLNEFLSSSTFQLSENAFQLPIDIYLQLKNSSNPFHFLQQLVEKLEDKTVETESTRPFPSDESSLFRALAA